MASLAHPSGMREVEVARIAGAGGGRGRPAADARRLPGPHRPRGRRGLEVGGQAARTNECVRLWAARGETGLEADEVGDVQYWRGGGVVTVGVGVGRGEAVEEADE